MNNPVSLDQIQAFNREKIIRANHPECETYEEALKKELKWNCRVEVEIEGRKGSICKIIWIIPSLNLMQIGIFKTRNSPTVVSSTTYPPSEIKKIIGLPLTFSRVWVTIHKQSRIILGKTYFYLNEETGEYCDERFLKIEEDELKQPSCILLALKNEFGFYFCNGEFLEPYIAYAWSSEKDDLELQSEKTQRRIAELLGFENE